MKLFKIIPLAIIIFSACNFNPDKKVTPEWEMDVLGPLVKADLSIQDIADMDNLHAQVSLSLSGFGVTLSGTAVIPHVDSINIGPYGLNFSDAYATANFESATMYFKITNELQMNINSGTNIIIRDNNSKLNLIDATLPDVPAETGSYILTPSSDLAGKSVSSNLTLQINNFSSDGSNGQLVNIDPSRKLIIDVYINNVKVNSVEIHTNNQFEVSDTSDFSITGGKIKSKSVTGTLTTYVTNNFPFEFFMQVYFLDESKTIKLDSLFDVAPYITASADTSFVITINETKTNNLNNSYYARPIVKLKTGTTSAIPATMVFHAQIVGDLKVKLDQ